jgi:hypothetical protein
LSGSPPKAPGSAGGYLLGAKYDYYLLKDSEGGARKEGEITGKPSANGPFTENIRPSRL